LRDSQHLQGDARNHPVLKTAESAGFSVEEMAQIR
jgi:hypothetical protein